MSKHKPWYRRTNRRVPSTDQDFLSKLETWEEIRNMTPEQIDKETRREEERKEKIEHKPLRADLRHVN